MKFFLPKVFAFSICILFSTYNAFAQVPQKFNYQGIARDAKGNPMAKQLMSLKLIVLPTSDDTEGEYEEIQSVMTNEFGLYNLQIGNGTPLKGEMKTVKWETGNKYIKVMIDPTGGSDFVDVGTTQLLSVPYAIYADKAGMAKTSNGDRTGSVSSSATHAVGDTNFLSKFTGFNTIGKSQFYDNGSSIGLGTTLPQARLHVNANTTGVENHIRMQNTNANGAGRFTMYNNVEIAHSTFTKYGTTFPGGNPGISALYPFANLLAFGNNGLSAGDGNGRFLISSGGNIGISIFKPGASKLKFHADFTTENVGIGGNSAPVSRVHLNNTDGTIMDVRLSNNTSGHTATDGLVLMESGNTGSLINRENGSLQLGTNNTTQMTITIGGNIELNNQIKIAGGSPGSGKVLTSDTSGLASWQKPNISTVENGLTKKNDTIGLGGRLNQNTSIAQDGRSFTLSDTNGNNSVAVSQLLFGTFTPLSATAVTQTFTAPSTGLLHSAALRLTGVASTSVTLELKNAQGNSLASQTISFTGLYDSLVNYVFSTKPLMQVGQVYTLSVTGSAGSNWYFSNANPLAGGIASTGAANDFTFQVSSMDESALFTSVNGKIGIGTNTPITKLDINGNMRLQNGTQGAGKILMSDANGVATWQALGGPDSQWASNGTHIFNNNSGNVGVGTNTPSSQLHLASPIAEIRLQNTAINTSLFITAPFNGGTGGIGTDGNHELPFFTNNIERLVIKDDGKVGIGTSTPNESALMHLSSTNKGVIFPQVSIDSLTDITSIANPANGLMVYNTTQPGVLNDMTRGYYWYSTNALSWVKLADNLVDNKWQDGGVLGIQLKDKTDGVEIMDNYTGSATNLNPKVKILKMLDSTALNSKNNINALVLTGVNKKTSAGWENRQKTSIIFENSYLLANGATSGTQNSCAISAYTESTGTTANTQTNGLAFYTTTSPANTVVLDTPTLSMFRHNLMIGGFATDISNVTEGRLQITGFSNGDQLSLRHPSSTNLKWGIYVSSIDSSLNFYSNGSLRANIDRVTGVYSALSDRRMKKDIIPLSPVLAKVKNLKAYNYRYLDSEETDRKVNGFMAQDLLTDFPELVYQRYDRTKDKPLYTVDYSGFGVIAIKAIQEQQTQIELQNTKIELLEKQNEMLLKRLEALENK